LKVRKKIGWYFFQNIEKRGHLKEDKKEKVEWDFYKKWM